MTSQTRSVSSNTTAPIETWYAISDKDRAGEQTLLAAMKKRFAEFSGSRRDGYDLMTAQTPVDEGVFFGEVSHGVKGWWVRSPGASDDRAILFFHGGAYALGAAKAYRGFASQLAVRAGVHAFVLDYPLAPESPFPGAYETALAARRRLLRVQGVAEIALVGDSAGGGLALATLGETIADSPAAAAAAKVYLNGHDPRDGRASPLYRIPDVMPLLAIQVGTDELLLDDATRYGAFAAAKRRGKCSWISSKECSTSSSGAWINYRVPALLSIMLPMFSRGIGAAIRSSAHMCCWQTSGEKSPI